MEAANLVNHILATLITGKVRFTAIEETLNGPKVGFVWGHHRYKVYSTGRLIFARRIDEGSDQLLVDSYSSWMEGVLNGKRRKESGELCTK